jgi:hypothetical protein
MWKLHDIQLKKVNRVFYQLPGALNTVSFDINSFDSLADNPVT